MQSTSWETLGWKKHKLESRLHMSLVELQELVIDREAWCAAVHGIAKSRTQLSDWTELNWTEEAYYLHQSVPKIKVKCRATCSWWSQLPVSASYHHWCLEWSDQLKYEANELQCHQISKNQPINSIHIAYMCCVCSAQWLSRVRLFVTTRTAAHQAPLSTGILQARILEWAAISFSRESSNPRI